MLKIFQSTWMALVIGSVLYLGTTALVWKMPEPPLEPNAAGAGTNRWTGPSWDFPSTDIDQLSEELRQEKERVALQRQELDQLKRHLDAERAELKLEMQKVQDLQKVIDKRLLLIHEEEGTNLKKIAKTYSSMTPDAAAIMLRGQNDDTVVKVFAFMKEEEIAPILETMARKSDADSKRAGQLLEQLRRTTRDTTPKAKP